MLELNKTRYSSITYITQNQASNDPQDKTLQTNSGAISSTLLGVARIFRIIITVEALGTLLSGKTTTARGLRRRTDSRLITSHAAITGCSRIVNALGVLSARRRRLGAETAAGLVLVLEEASAGALVDVFAVGQSRLADAVLGAGFHLLAAFLAGGLGGCSCEADGSGQENILEQHFGPEVLRLMS